MSISQDMGLIFEKIFGEGLDLIPFLVSEGALLGEVVGIADLTLSFDWVIDEA